MPGNHCIMGPIKLDLDESSLQGIPTSYLPTIFISRSRNITIRIQLTEVHNKKIVYHCHFLNEKCKQTIKNDLDDDMVHVTTTQTKFTYQIWSYEKNPFISNERFRFECI